MLVKVGGVFLAIALVFSTIFGAFRYSDLSMKPEILDGDMIISFRWDRQFNRNDLIVFWYNNSPDVSRVIAVAGEEVDIDSKGLLVNGSRLNEPYVRDMMETTQVKDAVKFPLTVPDGEVFVLGDNRPQAIDSRTFGCVEIDKCEGKFLALFRHRGL